jgi:hypothetical protein
LAGKLQWLHTTSSLAFTFYRAGDKRGAIPQDLQGGVVVHDHFLPYRRLDTHHPDHLRTAAPALGYRRHRSFTY